MQTIYKYPLEVNFEGEGVVTLPIKARTVFVGKDAANKQLCLWCRVDTEIKSVTQLSFRVVGTGQEIHWYERHIFSWVEPPYVWHLVSSDL